MPMPRAYAWLKEGETCRYCIGSGAALGGRCKHCAGLGKTFEGKPRAPCEGCDGQGKVKTGEPCEACGSKGWQDFESRPTIACRFCMGSGNTVGGTCKHCEGQGRLELDGDGNVIDLLLTAKAREQKCPECNGMGFRARGAGCDTCGGTGKRILTAAQYAAMLKAQGGTGAPKPAASKTVVAEAPPISQGNPLAQSKFGAAKFCMRCGSGIKPGLDACSKCGQPVNAPTPEAARIHSVHGGGAAGGAASATAPNPAKAMFAPPVYCKGCGTAMKAGTPSCPKCGKPAPAPAA
ncbi:MAG: hypothetical protein KGJ23_02565 [Euryarchaeota archaeon]|nr:hypothetical protein [Euryarchaeota archaeon]MDE1835480.1 hypothetical protein [Euryarchaeota archaeon]MDE1880373.1 hypothetical protein [Euryarchaeota archaeon]MDE2045761.1 hypothetical protein [Thermoplasmata archaeon]